jgi:transposase
MGLEDRPVLEPNAAGIDVGAREMFVARTSRTGRESRAGIRNLYRRSGALNRLAGAVWVTTVALESTGVYWIPLFEILEQRGIRPCLVNARHMKNVPGRRTDWHECQFQQPRPVI